MLQITLPGREPLVLGKRAVITLQYHFLYLLCRILSVALSHCQVSFRNPLQRELQQKRQSARQQLPIVVRVEFYYLYLWRIPQPLAINIFS